ncbi:MAG: two-component regulator propeller domain-containing protein [Dehalococcoidales bacterium]|nr:two-component regulator propeller domain-containing protein [Dehalococcoidales bacterium]
MDKNPLLSSNPVYTILNDSYGYMWFGGRAGLFKYDGIKVNRIEAIGNSVVRSIFEDSKGLLWVATESGLYVYNHGTKSVNTYLNNPNDSLSISSNNVWSVCEDNSGIIWIGTNNGLNSFDKETEIFEVYLNEPDNIDSISDDTIRVVYKDSRGALWIGTNEGINTLDEKTGVFTNYIHNPIITSDHTVWDIFEDSKGILWIATNEGLNSFDRETAIFTNYVNNPDNYTSISNNIIWDIYEDNNGILWIGTNEGLNSFDRESKTFTRYTSNINNSSSIGNNIVRAIHMGHQDILWLGTRAGVYYIDPTKQYFNYYYDDMIKDNGIRAIDISGDISILGTSTSIIWFNFKNNQVERYFHYYLISDIRNAITDSVYIDPSGTLWVGTDYIGLLKIDMGTGDYKIYSHDKGNPNSLIDGWIFSLSYSIEQELLWIGTNQGLCSFNVTDNKFTRYKHDSSNPSSISSNNINVVYCTEDGRIWIGTDQGLDRFDSDTGEFIHYLKEPGSQMDFIENQVESIYEDSNNNLWIGTINGLFRYNPQAGNFILYTKADGLPDNHILGIIEDNEGNIWCTTNHSLTKLSPELNIIINYSDDDGLRGHVNYRNSISKNHEGYIFVGNPNGLFSFKPEQIQHSYYFPPLVINDFSLINEKSIYFDKPVEELDEITLSYSNNSFVIDFVALDYSSQLDGKYAYMLAGFDSVWQYCGPDDSFAKYTNIPKGEYNFIVIASNSDGVWNTEGTVLKIIVTPPFWQEWWFILILVVLTLIAVAELVKIRTRVLSMHAVKLENQVEDRTLQLALKSHHLEDELEQRAAFSRALVHELKTPLTAVLAASSLLFSELKDEPHRSLAKHLNESAYDLDGRMNELFDLSKGELGLLRIERKPTDIIKLLTNVIEISKHEANRKKQSIMLLNESLPLPLIDIDESRIRQVVFNLLDNAIKFTPEGGSITVDVEINSSDIIIKINDTGIGMTQAELSNIFNSYRSSEKHKGNLSGLGLGLSLSKMFIELHGGRIWAESEEEKGSTFFFSIPFST